MKRKLMAMLCVLMIMVSLCACKKTSSVAFTWKLDNGESVEVELDTTESDLKLKPDDSSFRVENSEMTLLLGGFGTKETWDHYTAAIQENEACEVVSSNGNRIIWKVDSEGGLEYNMIEKVTDNICVYTGRVLNDAVGEETTQDVFDRLTFREGE